MQQVAIVTGGATGIGQAIAQALVNQGMNVVIAGRNQQRGEATAKELGDTAFFVQADVSQEADVQHLVAATLERYGRLDYLINNAGVEGGSGGFEDTPAALLDDVLTVNVKGVFLTMKHAIPLVLRQQGGAIINIASFVGTTMPIASAAIYGASKAAVLSLTRAAAAGYADQHLRVYAVCPWMTETPMANRLSGPDPDAMARYAAAINPSGQLATPADIAQAVADLLAGRTELPNGEAVLVDHASALSRIMPMTVA
ncbi:SDR family oxidoreductase [Hymenobacter sp. H14-R3]|uniref:SDR family NAD(P)-dependent oxidoreductase n=1 Tax=Hymenobacter sp. H14-R3 TaxID=3046308 RepID=UPI0024BAAB8C|nr:SDR family NAD(P)-dependent oxidoreductase [Hymenobacter sp. H14-R3]MDJ0366545.1 SDR family oxidoreductase [Hymenobacter sp. H14-R3]